MNDLINEEYFLNQSERYLPTCLLLQFFIFFFMEINQCYLSGLSYCYIITVYYLTEGKYNNH